MSVAEIVLVLTTLGTTGRWWFDRRDARSALQKAKDEADKTIARWEQTSKEKDETIRALHDELERKETRIAHLESLLFAGGHQ